ncbi:IS1595 family transposase [Clostridium sp. SYSU_GA19001]|nr:IS1595 family transposase [Clostridium caldaquaticum]MCM8710094.1 IS1595 family transposase [Clostridium caldaquaticum]
MKVQYLEEVFVLDSFATEVTNEVKKNRFSSGKVCPHCEHDEVSRNGKYNGKQRYICKSCRKTFTDFTRSPKHNSKKDVKQWIQYAKCMINGYSIKRCTKEVKINIPTSFYWRHKISDAIRAFMGIGSVGGVVEVDEAFIRESFKGNHKKSTTFAIPRKAHKRGVKGSFSSKTEKRKRGISKEQVCVLCAMNRAGNLITELICKGSMKHTDLERLFGGRIEREAIYV